jgi:stress-induced morphogen
MKNKNKNVSAKEIKAEFNIKEYPFGSPQSSNYNYDDCDNDDNDDDDDDANISDSNVMFEFIEPPNFVKVSPRANESVRIIYKKPASKKPSKPKLLNPTIVPKIESKIRWNILKCDLCSHSTSTKNSLENHMKVHIENGALYECQVCHKSFAKKSTLRNHESIHRASIDRILSQCNLCDKVLSSQASLNSHYNWFHSERVFSCDLCDSKKFATKGALKEHSKIHSNVKEHKCPICNKEYKTASTLTNHLDTHSNTEYKCSVCDLKLNTRRTLKQHEKVHSNVEQHKCPICSATFKRTKTFKEHLISHTKKRFYECEYCQKTFTNGSNLRKHLKEAHLKEMEEADLNNQQCGKKITKLPTLEDLLAMAENMVKA